MSEYVLPDGRKAPELIVQYACPVCLTSDRFNAYLGPRFCEGPVRHPHAEIAMEPLRLVHEEDRVERDVPQLVAEEYHYSFCLRGTNVHVSCTCGGPYDRHGVKL